MTPKERAKGLFRQGCNCGAPDIGIGVMHEPMCGWPDESDVAQAILDAEIEALTWALDQTTTGEYCGALESIRSEIKLRQASRRQGR